MPVNFHLSRNDLQPSDILREFALHFYNSFFAFPRTIILSKRGDGVEPQQLREYIIINEFYIQSNNLNNPAQAGHYHSIGIDSQRTKSSGEMLCNISNVSLFNTQVFNTELWMVSGVRDGKRQPTVSQSHLFSLIKYAQDAVYKRNYSVTVSQPG